MVIPLRDVPETAELEDEALLAAWQGGDDAAFDRLWQRHARALAGYATRLLGDHAQAEELVGDAFVLLAEGRWRPRGRLKAWLYTVVHRSAVDRLRRRSRWTRLQRLWRPPEPDQDPESSVLRLARHAAVEDALQHLPEEHRAAVLLFYRHDLSAAEVGDALSLTDQQVRSKLSYARRQLRSLLDAEAL